MWPLYVAWIIGKYTFSAVPRIATEVANWGQLKQPSLVLVHLQWYFDFTQNKGCNSRQYSACTDAAKRKNCMSLVYSDLWRDCHMRFSELYPCTLQTFKHCMYQRYIICQWNVVELLGHDVAAMLCKKCIVVSNGNSLSSPSPILSPLPSPSSPLLCLLPSYSWISWAPSGCDC